MLPQRNSSLMGSLSDFVHVYPKVLPNEVCDQLVSYFEENQEKHEHINNNNCPKFTQFNLTQNRENCKVIHDLLVGITFEYKKKYYEYFSNYPLPDKHLLEEFRIKRYNPNSGDKFDTHVDVVNYPSARRFLSFFWYLNTVEDGGNTVFEHGSIKPCKGSLVIFPPLWMFPHEGQEPISGAKYLLSTYLHYS